ncbi:tetratricopeptide repeat protein [Mangrovibacterium lignilyticum]|uniref:tetratricopeptide repeat protein n=1 Tax=Mangrovibacterium lignilyticum TaxID=2668052 RepID=UPI0013D42B90|nr:tetratricopeptide repeat protein [Mangrovibacterium lignilyticum]
MKKSISTIVLMVSLILTANSTFAQFSTSTISGTWLRMGHDGPVRLHFTADNEVEVDFGNDQFVDVVSSYELSNDTISFRDQEGATCPQPGTYKIYRTDDYLAFDLIDDNCGGRLKMTMGFWVKPDFQERLKSLSAEIENTGNPELRLNRGRMYMALGRSADAKADFDFYLTKREPDARVLVNRAGTRFPSDMDGVIVDCTAALKLDSVNKNAWFLRGLALYETGRAEEACSDFYRAIELGFAVLKEAEREKCAEYWKAMTELE